MERWIQTVKMQGKMGTVAQEELPAPHPMQRWALHGKWECRTANCVPTELPRKTETLAPVTYHVWIMWFISLCKLLTPHWATFQHAQHEHYRWALTYEVFQGWGFQRSLKKLSNLDLCKTSWFLKPKLFWEAHTSLCQKKSQLRCSRMHRKKKIIKEFVLPKYLQQRPIDKARKFREKLQWMNGRNKM